MPKMADRTGQQFGNYRLVSVLGQGGYAEVYLGKHVGVNQQWSINVLHAHATSNETEQFEEHPRLASYQYALGVVVYEWLYGERPFECSVSELIAQHLSMPPLPLRERVPAIPAEVEQMVLRALAKDPKARFASVAAFASALEQASQRALVSTAQLASQQPAPGQDSRTTYEPVAP